MSENIPKIINNVVLVPISKITANPNQPREEQNLDDISGLMQSIKENGLIQPVTLRRIEGGFFEIIAGERRTRSCLALGYENIPAIIEDITVEKSAILALVENIQRKDLDFFEEAIAMSSLINTYNITQDHLAKILGRSQSSIANKLRLLKLDNNTINIIRNAGLTERHSRALLKISNSTQQQQVANYIVKNNLNVEQTEAYIENRISKDKNKGGTVVFVSDVRIFFSTVKKAISFMKSAGIHIDTNQYEDEDYINYLVRILKSQSLIKRTTA